MVKITLLKDVYINVIQIKWICCYFSLALTNLIELTLPWPDVQFDFLVMQLSLWRKTRILRSYSCKRDSYSNDNFWIPSQVECMVYLHQWWIVTAWPCPLWLPLRWYVFYGHHGLSFWRLYWHKHDCYLCFPGPKARIFPWWQVPEKRSLSFLISLEIIIFFCYCFVFLLL